MNEQPKSPWAAPAAPTPAAPTPAPRPAAGKNPWTPQAALEPLIRRDAETYEREGGSGDDFRNALVPVLSELNLDSNDASLLCRLVSEFVVEPASPQQVKAWEKEQAGSFGLVYSYGKKNLAQRQQAVRRYLDARPKLKNTLKSTGLSSHPKVVSMLLNRAWALPRK